MELNTCILILCSFHTKLPPLKERERTGEMIDTEAAHGAREAGLPEKFHCLFLRTIDSDEII